MMRPFDEYDELADYNRELAAEVREFLIALVQDDASLGQYVRARVEFLRNSGLSDDAQAFLLESDYTRIQSVMKAASAPARWLVIWVI